MSTSQPQSSARSRPQPRKKVNDDAPYQGPPIFTAAGSKRQAQEKPDGESSRSKRKRVEQLTPSAATIKKDAADADQKVSMVDFSKTSTAVLHRYLTQFDIVPSIYPSPLTADDPPSPTSLALPSAFLPRTLSPPLPVTPANRPRRESKEQSRRRSSRLLEEENHVRTPILSDIQELHGVLAGVVERHFRELTWSNGREEVDTLASFMCAVEKAKGVKAKS
ncbi:hypothetical protein BDQ17DRAFT_1418460 [Cyathus striatus]|nr:hypothetical protein BDQ17DRAFT_1418460 [Cyathus striatus]